MSKLVPIESSRLANLSSCRTSEISCYLYGLCMFTLYLQGPDLVLDANWGQLWDGESSLDLRDIR